MVKNKFYYSVIKYLYVLKCHLKYFFEEVTGMILIPGLA